MIHRVDTDDPVVFVTIDDGLVPSSEALRFVREHQMPVSLFLNEAPARAHTAYFEEYIALGNWVHTHTLSHVQLTEHGFGSQKREICGMAEVLDELFGTTDRVGDLLRAPYGASDTTTELAAASCGQRAVVSWTGTVADGDVTLQGSRPRPGDILLTHFTDDLPANLRAIQEMADDAGLRVARLENYLG